MLLTAPALHLLQSQVNTGGVSVEMVDKAADIQETGISTPEDFWTPLAPPPKTAAYKEQYQPIKPPPEHDGTECLKWDDSLWSHADHIKVHLVLEGLG